MQQAKFSIILPVRNGGEYVKLCVKSILAQTLQDFNLIVLDNCSTDGTREWISTLNDARICLVCADKPLTIEESWERILHIEKNEFITMIGHDDVLLNNYLQTMQQLIEAHPGASLYQAHFNYIDSNGNNIRSCKPMAAKEDAAAFLKQFLTSAVDIMGTGFMMRSADYDALGGIPTKYPNLLFADMELWLRLTMKGYKATSTQYCFNYRIHQSTTKTTPDEKLQLAFEKIVYFLADVRKDNPDLAAVIAENGTGFIHHHCSSLSHRLLRTPQNQRDTVSVKSFIQKCKEYAALLVPGSEYNPAADKKILLAKWIDSNRLLQKLFLVFKKVFPGAAPR
jgi:glycosyltransferase involved in cell wall biosynthesis